MWASNTSSDEAAKKAANGTHIAIRIGNLQFDEGSGETPRLDLMVKGLSGIGFDSLKTDIHVGLTPDQGKRIRYNAIAIAAPTDKVPPRLLAILDGKAEGIIQFHEFPSAGSIGDEKHGDLMSGFTKAPFHGAAYAKRGIVKGVVLMSRASTQPRVEYVCGLLQYVVSGLAKGMLNANQHEIAKLNATLANMTDGDELADLSALKERKVIKGLAINRVLLHAAEYSTAYVPNKPGCLTFATRWSSSRASCRAAHGKATPSTLRASMAARCMCSPSCSARATSNR